MYCFGKCKTMNKKILKLFLLLLIPVSLKGQLTPITGQYVLNPLSINPGYAGNRGALNFTAFYRKQWAGITGSPETMSFLADAPVLDNKVGLGFILVNDKIGVTKETQLLTNYSYKIEIKDGTLSFGLGAGLITTNTKWSDLIVNDPGDEYYLVDSKIFVVPHFNFGTYFIYNNYFAGFSIPKLLGYKFNFDRNKYSLIVNPGEYSYLFNTGYTFKISSKLKFFPSTLVTLSTGKKVLYDINTNFSYIDRLWAGLSYRNNRSMAGLLQFAVNNQLSVAYTYDFDLGQLGRYSNGSHEIMLRYEFRYKVDAVNPLIF
jgi:type IX secretion system PorP/SprF family membrane protein